MIDITKIVKEEIIDKMDVTINVTSINGNVLSICDFKWIRLGTVFKDDLGKEYTVTKVDAGTITITSVHTFTGSKLHLKPPYFFVGTPIATNSEWTSFNNDERKKVPFAWMLEPTNEVLKGEQSDLERESSIHIVFLDSNDIVSWRTDDTHKNRLQGLFNMVSDFRKAIIDNPLFDDVDDMRLKNFTKFGKETASGVENNIIDANLTGVEMRVTLKILKQNSCKC